MHRLEIGAVAAASSAMAAASAFAVLVTLGPAAAIVAAAAAFLATGWLLVRIEPGAWVLDGFSAQAFPAFDADSGDELLLTEPYSVSADELVLDDVLERPDADARVVQLFDVQPRLSSPAPADASEALRQALLELRRSLN